MFHGLRAMLMLAVILVTFACGKTAGDLSGLAGAGECKPPSMVCGKSCTDIATDADHCGACGTACPPGDRCVGGSCTSTGCPAGQTDCGGLCTDLKTNPVNCGSCNTACTPPEQCIGGSCQCANSDRVCGGVCTDVASSNENCGACGNKCLPGESCGSGTCNPLCAPTLSFCDGRCVDLATAPGTCGDCQTKCKPSESCAGGRCVCTSDAAHAICGGICTNLATDNNNCGKCGRACPADTHCDTSTCTPCTTGLFFCPSSTGDPLAACLSQAATVRAPASAGDGAPSPLSPDPTCQCEHCLVELQDCVNDPECVAAWQCATTKGCTDHCFDTMGVCSMSGGVVGGCWKFCPPTTISTQGAMHAEALLRCTSSNGCGI